MPMIQRADLVERIRRAFNLVGAGSAGQSLSPELVPVVLVDDLTEPSIDEGYPRDAASYMGAGASVGVFSECFLINPAGSQVDLILYGWWAASSATTSYNLRAGSVADLTNLIGSQTYRFNLDLRTQLRPNAGINTRNQAAVVTGDILMVFAATTALYSGPFIPLSVTVPPGKFLSIVPVANNTAMYWVPIWKERLRTGQ